MATLLVDNTVMGIWGTNPAQSIAGLGAAQRAAAPAPAAAKPAKITPRHTEPVDTVELIEAVDPEQGAGEESARQGHRESDQGSTPRDDDEGPATGRHLDLEG